ncbi:MAG: hypothetical protein WAW62_04600 [Candidatus Saccharimonas aalborgensis]
MPRRNRTPKRVPYQKPATERVKVRYTTKQAAEAAIRHTAIYSPDISLRTYQSPQDGGWYLTSSIPSNTEQAHSSPHIT